MERGQDPRQGCNSDEHGWRTVPRGQHDEHRYRLDSDGQRCYVRATATAATPSVLSTARPEQIGADPFAHLAVDDALSAELSERLIREFPPVELIVGSSEYRSNKRFNLSAADTLEDERVSQVWRDVVRTHVSQPFLDRALELFGDHIRAAYPSFEQQFGPLGSLKAGIRRRHTFEDDGVDVLLDAQISLNTPVSGEATSVRRGHVDAPNKLFVGLLYLRHPDDDSTGGDLELYRYATDRPVFEGSQSWTAIDDSQLEVAKTVLYKRGTLVFFPNTKDALHGVTPRSPTPAPRLFMNLVAEVRQPLFEVALAPPPRPSLRSRVRGRLGRLRPTTVVS
jgi:hypothetical protein